MEHIGTITAAGQELSADKTKKVFKLHMDNPKYTYTLFDDSQKKFAEENIGKTVKVIYEMSSDGKHRNIEAIELATEAQVVAHNGGDGDINTRTAVLTVKDLWIAGKLTDTDVLVKGLRAELSKHLKVESAVPEDKPKPTEAYKDKDGDDVSKATLSQINALKKMIGIEDDQYSDGNFTNFIRTRFGKEALQIKDLSKNEAGDWITELQKDG